MVKRNPNFAKLSPSYLFPEIKKLKNLFLERFPQAALISLGIGDTTEPLPEVVASALSEASKRLGTPEGYSGYGPELGSAQLRNAISHYIYKGRVAVDDLTISDGAKCDLGRLQTLFGNQVSIAVQDPTYPVHLEGSLIQGVGKVISVSCLPENNFWPDWHSIPRTDLIYLSSPNNPTGAVATRAQLEELVDLAKKNRSIILFDAAYASYIQDPSLPRSIYEIPSAEQVAIEVGSFSKLAGFSGVRLGWTVVPSSLRYENGSSIKADWQRLLSTIFNGASNIAQAGGSAVLSKEGLAAADHLVKFYLNNATLLKKVFTKHGYQVFGGEHAPFLWVKFPQKGSWQIFQDLLENAHLITTPGVGFGSAGEGFLRLSAFGKRATIEEAVERLEKFL